MDKQTLIDIFRRAEGMRRFAEVRCRALNLSTKPDYPFEEAFRRDGPVFDHDWLEANPTGPTAVFVLTQIMIGDEPWASVTSGGHVIVPPFPFSPWHDEWEVLRQVRY